MQESSKKSRIRKKKSSILSRVSMLNFFEIVFSIFKTRKRCFIESVGNSKHVDNVLLKAPGKRDLMMAGFEGIHLYDFFLQ